MVSFSTTQESYNKKHLMLKLIRRLFGFNNQINTENPTTAQIVQDLLQGHVTAFRNAPAQQNAVLLELTTQQFSPEIYTRTFHNKFIAAISGQITILTFKNNDFLNDGELMHLIQRMRHLTQVTLIGCPKVTGAFPRTNHFLPADNPGINWVAALCRHGVTKITLIDGEYFSTQSLLSALPKLRQQYTRVLFDIRLPSRASAVNNSDTRFLFLPVKYVGESVARVKESLSFLAPHQYSAIAPLSNGWLASAGFDNCIQLQDVISGQSLKRFRNATSGSALIIALSKGLVASTNGREIKIWNVFSNECIVILRGHQRSVSRITALSDKLLASASKDNTIKIWNFESGELIHTFEDAGFDENNIAEMVAISDELLASVTADFKIKIWNTRTGQLSKIIITQHTAQIWALFASPKGLLVCGSRDTTISVWNIHTSAWVKTLRGHTGPVVKIDGFPNGWVVSGQPNGEARIWNLDHHGNEYVDSFFTNALYDMAVLQNGHLAISGPGAEYEGIVAWPLFEYSLGTAYSKAEQLQHLLHHPVMLLARNQLRVEDVAELFPLNLVRLDISNTYITDKLIKAILEQCPRLMEIKCEGCGWLTQEGIALIAQRHAQSHAAGASLILHQGFVPPQISTENAALVETLVPIQNTFTV